MDKENYQLLIDRALKLLSFRPRSKYEIVTRLTQLSLKKGIRNSLVIKAVSDLEKNRFLNDEDFARWWIEQRDNFRPKAKKLLKIELKNKGVPSEIIENVLSAAGKTANTEFELAYTLALKKLKKLPHLPPQETKAKLIYHLQSRGFSYDTISHAIDIILKKE